MMTQASRDWRVILLLVGGGGSGLLAVGVALSVAAYAAFEAWSGAQTTPPMAQAGISVVVGVLVVIGTILIIAAYNALMAFLGKPIPPVTNTPIRRHSAFILLLVWLAASVLAQAVVKAGAPAWLAPPLQILAIGSPAYLLVRLATSGLVGGTRLRKWGTLAAGLVCGTGISTLVEAALLLAGALAAAVFLVQNPDQLRAVEAMVQDLRRASGVESALAALQPILLHPITLVAVLGGVAVVTPIVEEVAKSAAPWLIYHRLRTAAEGFWCGAVSGGGFALFEGLMASADTSGNWTVIFLVRGWSSMMHILASGLAGWGIAAFRVTGRSSRLVMGYALAIAIHALWNGAVVGIGYGGVRSAFSQVGTDAIAVAALVAGGLTLLSLAVLIPAAILFINQRLRASVAGDDRHRTTGNVLALTSSAPEG